MSYRLIVLKRNSSGEETGHAVVQPGQDGYVDIGFTLPTIPNTNGPNITKTVTIISDVFDSSVIEYQTSSGTTRNLFSETFTITENITYIKFRRKGNTSEYTSRISWNGINYENKDIEIPIYQTNTVINIIATKNFVQPAADSPFLTVNGNSFNWNINDSNGLTINYSSTNSDFVEYSLRNTVRQLPPNGSIVLTRTDLFEIGQFVLKLLPVSGRNGSGNQVNVNINVVNQFYIPGPDIRVINYPEIIKGRDFAGFNVDFNISWQSINTNYIDIYVSKVDTNFGLGRFSPNGNLSLNVAEVLKKANTNYSENNDLVQFALYLIPYNTEGDSVASGPVEEIKILFDKGDLKLNRGTVVSDLRESFARNFNTDIFRDEISNLLTHYIHFGNGDNKLISTWGIDTDTFAEYQSGFDEDGNSFNKKINDPKSLVLKLYEPLPTNIQENQIVWISKIQSLPIIEQVTIINDEVNECTPLTPNFDIDITDDIGYQILDDLLSSEANTSQKIVEEFISDSSLKLTNLNLQFSKFETVIIDGVEINGNEVYNWSNFIKYSSASERVNNFLYKIKTIEFYQSRYDEITSGIYSTSVLSVVNESKTYLDKISKIKSDFDSFEKWMYADNTSNLTYPGAGETSVSSSDHPDTISWYNSIYNSALNYDTNNKSNLVNNLPIHISTNPDNEEFILFFNMIGQHFDILWNHISVFEKSKKISNTGKHGINDELVYHLLESLGWNADMGVRSQYLWEYAFGIGKDGDSVSNTSGKDRQQQIWRRILNNLPYLNKHKGTKRALHAAMACYGVPSSMLTVMEFGGPSDPTIDGTVKFTFEDRTASLNFTGTEYIQTNWKPINGEYPKSIELHFNTTTKVKQTLIEVPNVFKVDIVPVINNLAKLNFQISGSGTLNTIETQEIPIFYDDYYHLTINNTQLSGSDSIDIHILEGFNGRIRNKSNVNLTITGSNWNTTSVIKVGNGFIGKLDEFRLWTTPLDIVNIENHTLIPDAVDGTNINASTDDLLFRNDFEYPKNRAMDVNIKNVAYNQTYETSSIAVGFQNITNYPYNYTPYDRDVTATVPQTGFNFSDKIRFEKQFDLYGKEITGNRVLNLDYKTRSTTKSFDKSPIDSDRLGLFFSPTREINLDILKSIGNFHIDNYIGNPADEYKDEYSELKSLRNYYFKRYELNFNEYIQLVRYIDKTLFTTLESLVPARAKVSSGLLIEPHILERSKVAWKKPISTKHDIDGSINIPDEYNSVAEDLSLEFHIVNALKDDVTGYITDINGDVVDTHQPNVDVTYSTFDGLIDINTIDDVSSNIIINSGSDMGGISFDIDATFTGSIVGEYDGDILTKIGMDSDSISEVGFGLFGSGSHSIRTYIDKNNNIVKDRVKVFKIKEKYTVKVPRLRLPLSGSYFEEQYEDEDRFRYKVSVIPYSFTNNPTVKGNIVEVTPLNGYFESHYRYVNDLPTGLEYSYFKGSKQTINTTLDGGSPVVTFTTNPNILKVNDSGRGSSEPILIVE